MNTAMTSAGFGIVQLFMFGEASGPVVTISTSNGNTLNPILVRTFGGTGFNYVYWMSIANGTAAGQVSASWTGSDGARLSVATYSGLAPTNVVLRETVSASFSSGQTTKAVPYAAVAGVFTGCEIFVEQGQGLNNSFGGGAGPGSETFDASLTASLTNATSNSTAEGYYLSQSQSYRDQTGGGSIGAYSNTWTRGAGATATFGIVGYHVTIGALVTGAPGFGFARDGARAFASG